MLAAYAGLRASELAAVRREHVTERLIRIPQAKGGDPASVDTHPVIWDMVKSRPAGPLAVRPSGRPLSGHWLTARQRAHFDKIGMPDVTLHRFRHWFGTMLLDAGNDLRTVQESLRHRSITSTEGYTLVSGGQRRLAIRSLPTPNLHPREH
jgi:integrase/recombinase XerC